MYYQFLERWARRKGFGLASSTASSGEERKQTWKKEPKHIKTSVAVAVKRWVTTKAYGFFLGPIQPGLGRGREIFGAASVAFFRLFWGAIGHFWGWKAPLRGILGFFIPRVSGFPNIYCWFLCCFVPLCPPKRAAALARSRDVSAFQSLDETP